MNESQNKTDEQERWFIDDEEGMDSPLMNRAAALAVIGLTAAAWAVVLTLSVVLHNVVR